MVLKDFDLKSRFETERNRGYLKNTCYITVNSGAPWVRKFGKLSIPENLVMT